MPAPEPSALTRVTFSATMTAWVRAWRASLVGLGEVVAHIERSVAQLAEHEHMVTNTASTDQLLTQHAEPLIQALGALDSAQPDHIRLVLPTPGDTRGLPTYSASAPPIARRFISAAVDSGCAVVWAASSIAPLLGLVVDPVPGRMVTWHRFLMPATTATLVTPSRLPSWANPPIDTVTPSEADTELVETLHAATALLDRLEIGRMQPEQAEQLGVLRRGGTNSPTLPPGYTARHRLRLSRATAVLGIAEIASLDQAGGGVSSHDMVARAAALRSITTAARHVYTATINSPLETTARREPRLPTVSQETSTNPTLRRHFP